MEVASISNEYFDTKAYFKNKDRQLWQKGYVVGHNGLPIRRRKVKHNMSTKSMFFLSISSVVLFTLAVITILLWTGVITWGYDTICPEGFNLPNCERMDFLDTYIWQENKKYKINNQECYYGVAFRTWAPMASSVSVVFSNRTHTHEYPMTQQFDGCWFTNVCEASVDDTYYFLYISKASERQCSRLSIGAKEILFFNEPGQTNRISSSYSAGKLSLYDISQAIIYQVFLPAFLGKDNTDYYLRQLTYQISYFSNLGVNTLELFPIEQYSCNSSIPNCWSNLSIDFPGVVHQQFGTITQLREFVVTAHTKNIRVLLDISWALFDANSLLYDIDCSGSWGSFFRSEASAAIGQRRRLDFNALKQTGSYMRKIVNQWRNEAGIDGVVWLESSCLLHGGKFCHQGYGGEDFDAASILQNFRESSDYLHLGDSADSLSASVFSAVFNHSLYCCSTYSLTRSTTTAQTLFADTPLNVDKIAAFLSELNRLPSSVFCFEDRTTAATRFIDASFSTDRLRRQAMAVGLMLLGPTVPCLFMGTEFFTEQNFTDVPEELNWRFQNPEDKHHGFLQMTANLIQIRQNEMLFGGSLMVHRIDLDRGIILFSANKGDTSLFCVLNLSDKSITKEEMISLPLSMSLDLTPIFTTESSLWYNQFEDEDENIRVELCPDEERVYCLYASVHYHSLRVFRTA